MSCSVNKCTAKISTLSHRVSENLALVSILSRSVSRYMDMALVSILSHSVSKFARLMRHTVAQCKKYTVLGIALSHSVSGCLRSKMYTVLGIALSHSISGCFRSGTGSLVDRLDLPYWLEKCLLHADHCQHSCSYSEAFVLFVCVCL